MRLIPNFLSFLRIFFVLPIIYTLQSELYLLAAFLFFLSSITDFMDGYLARKYELESELGAFLDLIADKILVVTILVWLVFIYANQALTILSILIILREIIITSFRYFLVLNNADLELIKANKSSNQVLLSASSGEGLGELITAIEKKINSNHEIHKIKLDYSKSAIESWLHDNAIILDKKYDNNHVNFKLKISRCSSLWY